MSITWRGVALRSARMWRYRVIITAREAGGRVRTACKRDPLDGTPVRAKGLPLLGIVYNPNNDIIEIALEGLDHMVHKPREL